MENKINLAVERLIAQYASRDPELVSEVGDRIQLNRPVVEEAVASLAFAPISDRFAMDFAPESAAVSDAEALLIAETIVKRELRPVLKIRDNALIMDFFGSDSEVWRNRLTAAKPLLDAVIPAVGRVEVTNHPGYSWVGTGWLIANDVIVTNRHVAREFARRDNKQFIFRVGPNGPMTCRIDFLEEFDRVGALEFTASEVLWIAPTSEADIAFLRVSRTLGGKHLPRPVPLSAQKPVEDQFVATIGYPARDDSFPDQELVRRVFGDVYDKKRLAPGQVLESPNDEVLHDCSTLGGNSGSVVLDLSTGEAVALHYAGLFPSANYAVPASVVKDRLRRVLKGEFAPTLSSTPTKAPDATKQKKVAPLSADPGKATASFVIPLEITVSIGAVTLRAGDATISAGPGSDQTATEPSLADSDARERAALEAAKIALSRNPNVTEVRLGYRFENGWITDERVVVVEVKEEAAPSAVIDKQTIPEQFNGIGVEVRSAPMLDRRLHAEGVAMPLEERVARGSYRKPTHIRLSEVKNEPMTSVFHVSPDSGFPNLRQFFSRTQNRITATMYEFDAAHVADSLLDAVRPVGRRLTMVTQKTDQEMIRFIDELRDELNNGATNGRFDHAWASADNAISVDTDLLFPTAYHIKVAVRDGKEVWLSSGNWKNSGQPDIDPAGNDQTSWGPLRDHNREWHVIIENQNLASQFEEYIRYDVSEARRVPLPEAPLVTWPDIFVPDTFPLEMQPEIPAHYFDPLVVTRPLRIQPLLSPDNYIEHVSGLIEDAERSIYVQNQSFNLLALDDDEGPGDNEQAFYDLLALLRDRQETCDVKIILRDANEFGGQSWTRQKKLLERLKKFGFNLNENIKLQRGCHTKGVIVDSDKVLLGSHNWTNQGALYNRDASLIVYDAEVARYFERIFLFDWEHRARRRSQLPESVARLARPGEATPPGMRRVSMAEAFYDTIE